MRRIISSILNCMVWLVIMIFFGVGVWFGRGMAIPIEEINKIMIIVVTYGSATGLFLAFIFFVISLVRLLRRVLRYSNRKTN